RERERERERGSSSLQQQTHSVPDRTLDAFTADAPLSLVRFRFLSSLCSKNQEDTVVIAIVQHVASLFTSPCGCAPSIPPPRCHGGALAVVQRWENEREAQWRQPMKTRRAPARLGKVGAERG
ncbi:hypothetical protein XENOCAPTIV_025817, partial [Xenoophorus captivus]